MNSIIRKVLKKIGMAWVTGQIRAAAEGKLGPRWKALYWALAGKKRAISIVLGIAAGSLVYSGYPEAGLTLAALAAVGVSLGFVDANWRDVGTTETFKEQAWWQFLARNAPVITTALLAGLAWFSQSCAAVYCHAGEVATGVLGAVFVQIGILDAAWKADPPKVP